jgi:hypothetical protein
MFIWEAPIIDQNIFLARQPAPDLFTPFKDQRLKSSLGEMERSRQACHSPADDDRIIMFIH